MLMVYLIALIVGGVLLALTLVLGGAVDHHAGGDLDHHAGDGGHGGSFDAVFGWLPVTSLRFWTFFAAFFGAVGTVLSAWSLAGPAPAAVLAVAAG